MVETNGKSNENSDCNSENSSSKSKRKKRKRKSKNASGSEASKSEKEESEADIVEELVSDDDKNGEDQSNGKSSPEVGLAAGRSRRSKAGANANDAVVIKTKNCNKKEEDNSAVTDDDDEASSDVSA